MIVYQNGYATVFLGHQGFQGWYRRLSKPVACACTGCYVRNKHQILATTDQYRNVTFGDTAMLAIMLIELLITSTPSK